MPPTSDSIDPRRDPGTDLGRGSAGSLPRNATDPARRGTVPPDSVGRAAALHRRAIGWRSRDVLRTTALVLAMFLLTRLLWFAHPLFFTLFLGILFGIAVSAGVDHLQRLGIPRGIGAPLIVLSFFGLMFGFGAWMAPTLREQGKELRQKLPVAVDRAEEWVNRRQAGIFGILLNGSEAASPSTTTTAAAVDSSARDSTRAPAPGLKGRIAGQMPGITRYLFPFLSTTLEAFAGMVLIVFLSIYFAADPDLYRRGVLALLPARRRDEGAEVMDRVAIVLRKWLVTQLIAMAVMGAVTTIALLILHVKAAFALGILAGLFEFIPTVGPILSSVPAVAMAFLDSPEKAAVVVVVYIVLHFLESHILIPLLMKGGINLPPALTVVTQAMLVLVFGFMGLMVAVPLLATIVVLVQMLYVERTPDPRTLARSHDPDLDEPLTGVAAPAG